VDLPGHRRAVHAEQLGGAALVTARGGQRRLINATL
jgi:hypothetical protein